MSQKNFSFSLKFAIAIQVLAVLAILFNIPIVRQIVEFIYISFLPGFLLVKIFKLDFKSFFSELPFSVGLSIAFSMFLGLLVNELYPFLGVSEPLSLLPLFVTMSIALAELTFLAFIVSEGSQIGPIKSYSLPSLKQFSSFFLLASIPFLAVFGALLHSVEALLLMACVIALLIFIGIAFRKSLPAIFFPIAIIIISLSLTFQSEFISLNVIGWDTFGELYVLNSTLSHSLWNPFMSLIQSELADYNGMLSVTILPAIFSRLMGISSEWVIKIIYFLLFAFVPLTIYEMFKQNFGKALAFLSAFYFMIFPFFYDTVRRQIIGELFLALILFTILTNSISTKKKEFLIGVLGISLVVSHYSTFYVFIFCALFSWVSIFILEKFNKIRHRFEINKVLTARVLLVILAFAIFWYTCVSTSADSTFISFLTRLSNGFTSDFSSVSSRGNTVSDFVSPTFSRVTATYQADYFLSKIPYVLTALGLILFIKNRKKLNLQVEYFPLVLSSILLLLMTFVLPALGDSFVEERFYQLLLLFFAPIGLYGGAIFLGWFFSLFTNKKESTFNSSGHSLHTFHNGILL